MSKSNVTENDLVKFYANNVAMPAYGTTLYMHLHTCLLYTSDAADE